ncbi:MAG: prolipoprotein diacylglyceryl transferase, partial [Clostridia bacterium]|nr:prolipoprotein diacylglyceryl transferase [Clostridia bacterium]
MFPYITIFGRQIGLYTICAGIGVFAAGIFACRAIRRFAPNDRDDMLITLVCAAAGVLLGGHLLYAITNWESIGYVLSHLDKITSWEKLWQVLSMIFGGAVFYGGFLGG